MSGLDLTPGSPPAPSNHPDLLWRTCCIRMETPGQPYLHANGAHAAVGVEDVQIVDGRLRLTFTPPPAGETWPAVGAPIVDEDESMSAKGIHAGGSGGVEYLNIDFGIGAQKVPITDSRLWGSGHNLWVLIPCFRRTVSTPPPTQEPEVPTPTMNTDNLVYGWANAGIPAGWTGTARWSRRNGLVTLQLVVQKTGTDASGVLTVATLPPEGRPDQKVSAAGVTSAGGAAPAQVFVETTGAVTASTAGDWVVGRWLRACVTFPAAPVA